MEDHNTMFSLAKGIKPETDQVSRFTCQYAGIHRNCIMSNQSAKSRWKEIVQPKKSKFLKKYTKGKEK